MKIHSQSGQFKHLIIVRIMLKVRTTSGVLVLAILWETLTFFEIDHFFQISYHPSLTVFFRSETFMKQIEFRVFAWWPEIIISFIFWNFLTRQSQKSWIFLPLIYGKTWFNMNFQFICWLFVPTSFSSKSWHKNPWSHENATSFSSKWWRYENGWRRENATWYILSIFPLVSIFWCATMILKTDFIFAESLHWCEIILEFFQFWGLKITFQTNSKPYLLLICDTSSLRNKNTVAETPSHQKLIKFEVLSYFPRFSWKIMTSSK